MYLFTVYLYIFCESANANKISKIISPLYFPFHESRTILLLFKRLFKRPLQWFGTYFVQYFQLSVLSWVGVGGWMGGGGQIQKQAVAELGQAQYEIG